MDALQYKAKIASLKSNRDTLYAQYRKFRDIGSEVSYTIANILLEAEEAAFKAFIVKSGEDPEEGGIDHD